MAHMLSSSYPYKKTQPTTKEMDTLLVFYKQVGTERFIKEFGEIVGLREIDLQPKQIEIDNLLPPVTNVPANLLHLFSQIESNHFNLVFQLIDLSKFNQACFVEMNIKHQVECFRIAAKALEWRCKTHAPTEFNKALQIVNKEDFDKERITTLNLGVI